MNDEITIGKILTLIQSEYPNSFSNMDARTMALKKQLWTSEFQNEDLNLVYAAVRLLMKENREFAPNIGQIREKMRLLTEPEELTEAQAWAMVSRACANGLYGYQTEFDKLPPEVQQAIGAPEQLKEWAAMDTGTVQSVVASNFRKSFRVQQERKKQLDMLPPEIRRTLGSAAAGMRMIPDTI